MEEIKQRITNYWTQRSEMFAEQRIREFRSDLRDRWMDEFRRYIPMDRPLRILDLGTGTGFFALMLAAEGHKTVGVDLTESMIEEARKTSAILEIPAEFYVMDAENPAFAPQSFDVLVTRNLTWALPHLPTAYGNWQKLLKPGGVLINFDADYCREAPNQEVPENHAHKLIDPELIRENGRIKDALRPVQCPRPQWDVTLLTEAGFHDIQVDTAVWKRVYREFDEFYNPTPIFTIAAYA